MVNDIPFFKVGPAAPWAQPLYCFRGHHGLKQFNVDRQQQEADDTVFEVLLYLYIICVVKASGEREPVLLPESTSDLT